MQFQYGKAAKHQLTLKEFDGIAGDQQVSVKHQLEFNEGHHFLDFNLFNQILDDNFNLHVDESRVLVAFAVKGLICSASHQDFVSICIAQRLVKVN